MRLSQELQTAQALASESPAFPPMSARRLLVLGGIALILVGMLVGDIFAVFVLHPNAARVGESLAAAAHAAVTGDANAVLLGFQSVGAFLENRGTKVDTHVHMVAFGYLALLLAVLEPWIAFRETTKQKLTWIFLLGAWLLPTSVFLIHYVGLAYSPLAVLGWASLFADFGGALIIGVTLVCLLGLGLRRERTAGQATPAQLLDEGGSSSRILLAGGLTLVLLGFFHGAYYAAVDLYRHEALDYRLLLHMSAGGAAQNVSEVEDALVAYGRLGGEKAVNIAAHAHAIEFGLLAMLLGFFQGYVRLRDAWKRRWAWVLLLGSLLLPVCVLLELKFGLLAGGIADIGGFLVIAALLAMWMGVLRYTGEIDAASRVREGARG